MRVVDAVVCPLFTRFYPITQYPIGTGAACPPLSSRTLRTVCSHEVSGLCGGSECVDGLLNNRETDVDCGGGSLDCPRCAMGRTCLADSDCTVGSVCGVQRTCVPTAPVDAAKYYLVSRLALAGTVELSVFSGPAQRALVAAVVEELLFRGVQTRSSDVMVLGVTYPRSEVCVCVTVVLWCVLVIVCVCWCE
jgi:hypothetical protein